MSFGRLIALEQLYEDTKKANMDNLQNKELLGFEKGLEIATALFEATDPEKVQTVINGAWDYWLKKQEEK